MCIGIMGPPATPNGSNAGSAHWTGRMFSRGSTPRWWKLEKKNQRHGRKKEETAANHREKERVRSEEGKRGRVAFSLVKTKPLRGRREKAVHFYGFSRA